MYYLAVYTHSTIDYQYVIQAPYLSEWSLEYPGFSKLGYLEKCLKFPKFGSGNCPKLEVFPGGIKRVFYPSYDRFEIFWPFETEKMPYSNVRDSNFES